MRQLKELVHASVLAQSSLLIDILESPKNLSLKMQKNNLSIIDVVDAVEKTKTKYLRLLKKLTEEKNVIFTAFLAFKKIVKKIEEDENESGEPMSQGDKMKRYTQEKKYFVDNAAHIIKSIVEYIEE